MDPCSVCFVVRITSQSVHEFLDHGSRIYSLLSKKGLRLVRKVKMCKKRVVSVLLDIDLNVHLLCS